MTRLQTPPPRPRRLDVALLFLIASCWFLALKLHQFRSFGVGMELSDFEILLWNTLHGRFLQMPCSQLSFLSEHFSPILLLLVPVYWLFPFPHTLLVVQALACSAAIVPLYLLVSRFTPLRWPPIAVCLAYAVSRVVNYGLMYDFHPEIFYPFFFFGAFLAFHDRRWSRYYALLALAATVKEDAFIAILGVGLYAILAGQRKHGLATVAGAVAGLASVIFLVIPFFREQPAASDYKFIAYWSGYGSTQREVLLGLLNPVKHVQVILTPAKLRQMFNLFSVFLFLPFVSWRAWVCLVLPNWFLLYSSDHGYMNGPIIYYGLLITPFLFYSALAGTSVLAGRRSHRRAAVVVLLATSILVVQLGNSRIFKQLFQVRWAIPERFQTAVYDVIRMIPPDAAVSAQINLGSHLPIGQCRSYFPSNLAKADFVLLDERGNRWPLGEDEYRRLEDSLRSSREWVRVAEKEGFLLLRRSR